MGGGRKPKGREQVQLAPEDRIRRHYKAIRRRSHWHEYGVGAMWLFLARRWKRPVQELKRICRPHRYVEEGTK